MNLVRNYYRFQTIIFCIGGATTFWFLNALNKVYTTYINHPVVFITGDVKEEGSPVALPTLSLEVTGGGWQLLRYLLRFNVKPIELSVVQIPEHKEMQKEYLYHIATKEIKDLRVHDVWINGALRVHTPSQESLVG